MRKKKHRKRPHQEVELNLAAMLDMAFQLLAFFILTFRPSPVESELAMNLPPAVAMTNIAARDLPTSATGGGISIDPLLPTTVVLNVTADANGNLTGVAEGGVGGIFSGGATASNLYVLELRLRELFGFPGSPFDRLQIQSDPRLRYDQFMKVVDVCLRQKLASGEPLTKLGFVELPQEGAGAAPPAGG